MFLADGCNRLLHAGYVHEHVTGYLSRAKNRAASRFSRTNGPYRERYLYGH
jgi:hypothetical protein